MSISFNNSGLLTRGFGPDHRVLTRGMGKDFEIGGMHFDKRFKAYSVNLMIPISKEEEEFYRIYSPLEVRKFDSARISSNISKELEESLNLLSRINSNKLFRILDEI